MEKFYLSIINSNAYNIQLKNEANIIVSPTQGLTLQLDIPLT